MKLYLKYFSIQLRSVMQYKISFFLQLLVNVSQPFSPSLACIFYLHALEALKIIALMKYFYALVQFLCPSH